MDEGLFSGPFLQAVFCGSGTAQRHSLDLLTSSGTGVRYVRLRTLTSEENLSISDGVGDARERSDIGSGIQLKDYKVGIEAWGNASGVGTVAEALRGVGSERGQDLREGHACARHQVKLFSRVVMVDVTGVGAKEDLTAGGGIGMQLADGERDALLRRFRRDVVPLHLDIEERQSWDQAHVRRFHAGD